MAAKKQAPVSVGQKYFWVWVGLGVVVIILIAYLAGRGAGSNQAGGNTNGTHSTPAGVLPDIGQTPPDFTLTSLNGKTYTLSQLRGHPVWLNFWATWCVWCKRELPNVEAAHKALGNKIILLGIDEGEGPNTVRSQLKNLGIDYTVLLDRNSSVGNEYGVRGIPTSIFINAQGKVTAVYPGAFLDEKSILQDAQSAISGS